MTRIGWLEEDGRDEWRIARIDPCEAGTCGHAHGATAPALPLTFDSQPALPFAAAPWETDGADCEPGWYWTGDGQERRVVEVKGL